MSLFYFFCSIIQILHCFYTFPLLLTYCVRLVCVVLTMLAKIFQKPFLILGTLIFVCMLKKEGLCQWIYSIGHYIFFFVLIMFYSIGKIVSNNSKVTDHVRCHMTKWVIRKYLIVSICWSSKDHDCHVIYILFGVPNYLYFIRTFALTIFL